MDFSNIFLIIPSYNPTETLISLIKNLKSKGFDKIIVINDGSSNNSNAIFEKAKLENCILITHEKNFGKGKAIKSGISEVIKNYKNICGIITVDCDWQYSPEDIVKIAEALIQNSDSFILGIRDFSKTKIPLKYKIRYFVSSVLFKLSTGKKCKDTQSGLRGIPEKMFQFSIDESGKRYEYEMNFLMDAMIATNTIFVPIGISQNYDHKTSYYRLFKDSFRAYSKFITFIVSSLLAYILDIFLFSMFGTILLPKVLSNQNLIIWISTATGKAGAGIINFIINKKYSFKSKHNSTKEFLKYIVVFLIKFIGSAGLVSLLKFIQIPLTLLKCLIDTIIFFISYRLQKVWVFRKKIDRRSSKKIKKTNNL